MEKIWKKIPFTGNKYYASNMGEIKNLKTGKILKPIIHKTTGYHAVTLSYNSKQIKYTIHKLIALTFIPNPENKPAVHHKNGIKVDNRVVNLEWVTTVENTIHSINNRDLNRKDIKLTPEKVKEIKALLTDNISHEGIDRIAEMYGVNYSTIHRIKAGTGWYWII